MDDGSCNGASGAGAAADNPSSEGRNSPPVAAPEGRRPFTSLSQEEADLALARVLQEQERAYMMLTGQGGGAGYAVFDYDEEEDEEEDGEEDVSDYEEEEGDGEEALGYDEEVGGDDAEVDLDMDAVRYDGDEVAGRLMALAGFGDWPTMEQVEEEEDEEDDQQGAWDDVDPDEYSYEELVALGEVVGTESKGISADTIASLPSITYQAQDKQDDNLEQCVICRVEFDEGESLVALPCKHSYHAECINHWLQLNKVCPMCSAEVPTSVEKKP